jgi:hypothetical protein
MSQVETAAQTHQTLYFRRTVTKSDPYLAVVVLVFFITGMCLSYSIGVIPAALLFRSSSHGHGRKHCTS